MLLGYTLIIPDNGDTFIEDDALTTCSKYSNIYDLNIMNPDFALKKKKYNISSTYDSFTIVSEKFKTFCQNEKYKGLKFITLPKSQGFYWFKVNNIIEFDCDARKTRFINYSEACDGYEEIIGADPACLKNKTPLPDGFFRSDICFGSTYQKSPLEIVGKATMTKLKLAGFKEIFFEKILDVYDWQKNGIDPNELIIGP